MITPNTTLLQCPHNMTIQIPAFVFKLLKLCRNGFLCWLNMCLYHYFLQWLIFILNSTFYLFLTYSINYAVYIDWIVDVVMKDNWSFVIDGNGAVGLTDMCLIVQYASMLNNKIDYFFVHSFVCPLICYFTFWFPKN